MSNEHRNVFMDITIGGVPQGRLEMALDDRRAPRTAANFRALCEGGKAAGTTAAGRPRGYKGSAFHRVIKSFMVQGGDFTNGDGTGGESIYGGKFADEAAGLRATHDARGVLSMANSGPNSNGSQFFITCRPSCPHLDGKHVVFGRVVRGLDVLRKMEAVETGARDAPISLERVVIADCGVVDGEARGRSKDRKRDGHKKGERHKKSHKAKKHHKSKSRHKKSHKSKKSKHSSKRRRSASSSSRSGGSRSSSSARSTERRKRGSRKDAAGGAGGARAHRERPHRDSPRETSPARASGDAARGSSSRARDAPRRRWTSASRSRSPRRSRSPARRSRSRSRSRHGSSSARRHSRPRPRSRSRSGSRTRSRSRSRSRGRSRSDRRGRHRRRSRSR